MKSPPVSVMMAITRTTSLRRLNTRNTVRRRHRQRKRRSIGIIHRIVIGIATDRDRDRDRDRSSHSSSSKKLEFPREKLAYISKEHNRMRRKLGEDPERNNSWFIGAFCSVYILVV